MNKVIKNFKGARVREVIEITTLEGKGIMENPYRGVTWYLDKNGNLLAYNDPLPEKKEKWKTFLLE